MRMRTQPNEFPAVIVCDLREQLPFKFDQVPADKNEGGGFLKVKKQWEYLPTGDYSLLGHQKDGITIERKSKDDLWRTLSREMPRFERELARMELFHRSFIIVEVELSELLQPPKYRDKTGRWVEIKFPAKVISREIMRLEMEYPRTHWKFLPGKKAAENVTIRLFEKYLEHIEMNYKGNK